jgi:hypothetical protein
MAGIRISAEARDFSPFHSIQTDLGPTQPRSKWVPEALSLGENRTGHEADYSPPSSTEVKNGGAILLLPYTSQRRGA